MDEKAIRKKIEEYTRKFYDLKHKESKFVSGKTRVNYAGRVFDEKEMISLINTSLDFWLTLAEQGDEFERKFSEYLGISNTILANSGSSANLLAISSLCSEQLREHLNVGDEIITPATTFPTTLNPILQNGLKPVFLDIELSNYNMSLSNLEAAFGKKTRGIFIPHTLGNPNEMDVILDFAKDKNLFVIEDSCDALGSKYKGKLCGTFGDIGTFSFYPAHHITMGEGGAVCTENRSIAKIVTSLRDWGRSCYCRWNEKNSDGACKNRFNFKLDGIEYDHRYMYDTIGYNLKPLDLQAAIGNEQLKKFPEFMKARKKNFKTLYSSLEKYEDVLILPESVPDADPCWFAFPITIKKEARFTMKQIVIFLENNLIQTRRIFAGNIIHQPAYKNIKHRIVGGLENSDFVMKNSFFVGVYPGIDEDRMNYMLDKFRDFLERNRQ